MASTVRFVLPIPVRVTHGDDRQPCMQIAVVKPVRVESPEEIKLESNNNVN